MNVLPQQLIGKTIKDCYFSDKNVVTIEFTDGTKIKIDSEEINIASSGATPEDFITLIQ